MALDDPEAWQVYRDISATDADDPDMFLFTNLTGVGNVEVNAFQRHADVVIQKSIREGFARGPPGRRTAASAARTFTPPALPTTPTRLPCGSGWSTSTRAMCSMDSRLSARMTPAWTKRLSTAVLEDIAAAVCESPARRPDSLRPPLTASTGLRRATERAMRANLRGLPNDSRYGATALHPGSSYQYESRSLPETSALLPRDTKVWTPRPVRVTSARAAMPTAPDWEARHRPPGGEGRRREDDGGPDARGPRGLEDSGNGASGNRHDDEICRLGQCVERWVRRQPGQLGGRRVDGIYPPAEPVVDDRLQDLVADPGT
jgi:hypothetical protein